MEEPYKTYVITSAQALAEPNAAFLNSLDTLVENLHAKLIVLPMIGNCAAQDYIKANFHERLQDKLEYGKIDLNSNIRIDQFNVRPYQIDPITGLQRFAQREKSLIFSSPKQRWIYVAHSNRKMPKALVTTGACTEPNYATGHDVSAERRRLGDIATRDHEYGAIVVRVVDDTHYHWRNIIAGVNGKFTDLGIEYDGKARRGATLSAMVLGDWHNGYTDGQIKEATYKMIAEFKPQNLIIHDFFNGHSVSHHMQRQLIQQMIIEGADKENLCLESELFAAGKELDRLSRTVGDGKIYIVRSNHLEFLERYLDEGRFVKDALNAKLAFKLAVAFSEGKDPVEEGVRLAYGNIAENIIFLSRWDDLKINGYLLGSHGDNPGNDFNRGSIRQMEIDAGKGIRGHCHSSEKLRQVYSVGCMLPFDTFYLKNSPNKWTHSHALLYETGVQMLNIINSSWR